MQPLVLLIALTLNNDPCDIQAPCEQTCVQGSYLHGEDAEPPPYRPADVTDMLPEQKFSFGPCRCPEPRLRDMHSNGIYLVAQRGVLGSVGSAYIPRRYSDPEKPPPF